jgi:SH3-like domain-containing protein
MRLRFLATALLLSCGPAPAQGPRAPDGTVECRFEGWSNDLDEKGQPLRAAPDPTATVVARLPPPVGVGLDEVSVTVTVTGYRDGWFRIAEAGYSDEVQGVPVPRRVARATGWVPAGGVKALIAAKELKSQPAREAATVAALSGFRSEGGRRVGFGPDGVAVKRLLSCRGAWIEVETELGTGWVEKVCARQLGACP